MIRPVPLVRFAGRYAVDLVTSNLTVARTVWTRPDGVRPALITVGVDFAKPVHLATYANLISLTPGTTSVDVADDGKALTVHVLDAADIDAVVADLADMAARLKEVFA